MMGFKCVYVMKSNNGAVKIGVSQDVGQRIKSLETKDLKIVEHWNTEPCENPFEVERKCHEHFALDALGHEWFSIDYSVAIETVKRIYSEYAKLERDCHLACLPREEDDTLDALYEKLFTARPSKIHKFLRLRTESKFNYLKGFELLDIWYADVEYMVGENGPIHGSVPAIALTNGTIVFEIACIKDKFILKDVCSLECFNGKKMIPIADAYGRDALRQVRIANRFRHYKELWDDDESFL